jgi:hypothetical protein
MNTSLVASIVLLGVVAAESASAQFPGATSGHHGSLCQLDRDNSAPGTRADYSRHYGVHNPTSGTIAVVCPIQPVPYALEFKAIVYDRHYSDPVSCTLRLMATNGNAVYEETRRTSDYGYNWSPGTITLSWRLPNSSLAYRTGTLYCVLPPTGNFVSAGLSHVTSYYFQ